MKCLVRLAGALQIDFNLQPKSTFNFMEGRKLCIAFVSDHFENLLEQKLATRDFESRFGNELN